MRKNNSILIIDDHPTNIKTLRQIIGDEYIFFAATDGKTGIECAAESLPDVILLDILMPDMDGYAVIGELKGNNETKHIPVIFVTALDDKTAEEKGLASGAADYISKPFHAETVRLRVKNQIELIRLQRELEDAVKAAQTANNAKSAFLANMSHEIRTPMHVIIGLTEFLLEDAPSLSHNALRDYLKKIHTAGDILLGLINDILDISKIESGKLSLVPTQYETTKLLNDIITLNIFRIENKPVAFKLNTNGDIFKRLYGDDLRVKQVLNNLLSNAFKYTREGTVTLSVSGVREKVDILPLNSLNKNAVRLSFSVSDTGIGIRKNDLKNLFDDYNQVDTKANRLIEGTGLGLSIAKGLTELMNGEITVESEYGNGTVFCVSFLQEFVDDELIDKETIENLCNFNYTDKENTLNNSIILNARPDLSDVNILVVDNYIPNLDVARWMLGKYKMKVSCVTSGREAIDAVKSEQIRFNAIFMDHMMPGMDGIEAVRHIRALDSEYAKTIPVIALTANAVAGNERLFTENGFQAFLTKPVNLTKLDAVIRKLIIVNIKDIEDINNTECINCNDNTPAEAEEAAHNTLDKKTTPSIEISGIDYEAGLALFEGDEEMFLDFIRSFADNIPAELEKLRFVSRLADYDAARANLPNYAIDVHTIKGAAAGIAAIDLFESAKRLEKKAKAGDLEGVLAKNTDLIRETEELISNIRACIY
ncbi:MAG: response regulator [Oscillospiraceae bacterium]|nr:response regulator [Oscillospiraceae bacterium]